MRRVESPATLTSTGSACPDCTAGTCSKCGSKVPSLTLTALLTEEAKTRLASPEGFRFCGSPQCETVYRKPETGERFRKSDLRVRVGLKETTPPRPVCYCFGFSVEDIEAQVRASGTSAIPDEIAAKIRQGLCHCADANPQGTCCLGNVRAALKVAQDGRGAGERRAPAPSRDGAHDCCAREAAPTSPVSPESAASRAGLVSSIGAVASAVLASACCWLPLLLIMFGASAASVAGFFEHYRLAFLGGSGILLAFGFYFVYFRKEKCGPDGVCAAPNRRAQRFNKVVLWVASALVVTAGAFPEYVGVFLRGGIGRHSSETVGMGRVFSIEGMTCEACTVTIRSELEHLPGVASVEVSFEQKEARIKMKKGEPLPPDGVLVETIDRAGYRAAPKGVAER